MINPNTEVDSHDIELDEKSIIRIFQNCDVIIEAFDKAEMKQLIIETVIDNFPKTPLIIGLGMAGWGDSNSIACRQTDNIYICGDETTEVSNELPPLAPRVGIVSNMQANTALEILLKE